MENICERIAVVEAILKKQEKDIDEIKQQLQALTEKMDGYLETRVKNIVKAMIGEIFLAVLSSSAVISLVISLLFRR